MVSCWEQGVGTRLDSHERPCQENGISCSNGEGLYVDFLLSVSATNVIGHTCWLEVRHSSSYSR